MMEEGNAADGAILFPQENGKKRAIRLMRTKRDKDPILEEQKKREEETRKKKEEAESKRKEEEQLRETERKKKEEAAAALEAAKCKVN